MGKILITAEKPSAAADMAKKDGYYESDKYIITWALGHLVEQKLPHEHNPAYKAWKLEDLPFNFDISTSLKVSYTKKKKFNVKKKLIKKP